LVSEDLSGLRAGGCSPTAGDALCLAFGHLARMTVWNLRGEWDADAPLEVRMQRAGLALRALGSLEEVTAAAHDALSPERRTGGFGPLFELGEPGDPWNDAVSF